ncbi:MAG: chromate transporter [Rikenellaceae bacterium]
MMQGDIKLRDLFFSFMKIGLFTFGGGYAMIPLIEREVIERRAWVDKGDFVDLLTIAQSIPGALALNASAFVGYKSRGYVGAIASVGGVVFPSFAILLLVALFFASVRDNAVVAAAFNGMRPAVVALMVSPIISLLKGSSVVAVVVAVVVAFIMWWFTISPVYFILLAVVYGVVWGFKVSRRVDKC